MTGNNTAWEPSEEIFSNQYDAMNDFSGKFIDHETVARGQKNYQLSFQKL